MKPKVEKIGENGVRLEIEGADPVTIYGEPGMDVSDLVAAAAERLGGDQPVVVQKPGAIVIPVPKFEAKGAQGTAKAVQGDTE